MNNTTNDVGHYEPPLVEGGQGRSAAEVRLNALHAFWMLATFLLVIVVALCPWWFSLSCAVILAVTAIALAVCTTTPQTTEPGATTDRLDTTG